MHLVVDWCVVRTVRDILMHPCFLFLSIVLGLLQVAVFYLCCVWLSFRISDGRSPGCQVTWTPGRKGFLLPRSAILAPALLRLVLAGSTLGCVGRCKRCFQRDVSLEGKRHCCLARRSLSAARVPHWRHSTALRCRWPLVSQVVKRIESSRGAFFPPPTPVLCSAVPQISSAKTSSQQLHAQVW